MDANMETLMSHIVSSERTSHLPVCSEEIQLADLVAM